MPPQDLSDIYNMHTSFNILIFVVFLSVKVKKKIIYALNVVCSSCTLKKNILMFCFMSFVSIYSAKKTIIVPPTT